VIPVPFEYLAPASVEEALSLLTEHGDEAKILAGGHSLLPLMKLRLAAPAVLVDLGTVDSLRYIREEDGQVSIGAMTTYAAVEHSETIRRAIPMLAQAVSLVGDMQVRNRGTLGGALAHADPAGDMPAVVSALGGSVLVRGPQGQREIDISDFFVDIFTSALEPDEILTEIRLRRQEGAAGSYVKFRRRQIDWAIVGAAVSLSIAGGKIGDARVALTNVGPTPVRATAVENALQGAPVDDARLEDVSQLASENIDPQPELNASSEYKRHLARVLTRRALQSSLA
jgi:aerobic carbon-monoxide dehydrogenase medium subunit